LASIHQYTYKYLTATQNITSSLVRGRREAVRCFMSVSLASIVQYVQRNLLLLVVGFSFTAAYNQIKFCSVLIVVVHAAGCECDKQDSLMCHRLCGKQHRGPSQYYCCSHSSSHRSDSQILVEHRDFCLTHLHSTSNEIAMKFGTEKLEWCGYPTVKNLYKIK